MSKGKALDELTKQQVIYLWMNRNFTQSKIAKRLGIGTTTVKRIIQEYVNTGAHQPPEHMDIPNLTQINEEFDAAVDAMIADSKSADAEEPAAIAEPDKLPAAIPDYVLYAVDCRIADLEHRLQDFADQKAMLEHDLRRLQENIESVQDEHDKLADWKLEVDP